MLTAHPRNHICAFLIIVLCGLAMGGCTRIIGPAIISPDPVLMVERGQVKELTPMTVMYSGWFSYVGNYLVEDPPRRDDESALRRIIARSPEHRHIQPLTDVAEWVSNDQGNIEHGVRWIVGNRPLIVGIDDEARPGQPSASLPRSYHDLARAMFVRNEHLDRKVHTLVIYRGRIKFRGSNPFHTPPPEDRRIIPLNSPMALRDLMDAKALDALERTH